jgi:tripartite-type tricarboxylate transporter receptor subunit TctC
VHDFKGNSWHAMFAPAKTPKPIIDELNRALNGIVREPDIRGRLLQQGSEGVGGTPEALAKIMNNGLPKWAKQAKEANIRAD